MNLEVVYAVKKCWRENIFKKTDRYVELLFLLKYSEQSIGIYCLWRPQPKEAIL